MDFFQSGPPLRPLGPEPVVRDKPLKVREMTRAVLIPKAAKSSDKLPGNPARTEVPAETYYEAYVDDTKYLVPDTNLVAMKDMINYKMRPKTSIKYKNETRFEDVNYKHLHRRLGSMLDKVEIPSDIEQSSVIGDRQRKSSREIENEEVTVGGDPEMRAIIEKEDDEETVIGELQPKLSSEKDNEEEFTESTINNDEKESQEKTVVTAEEQLTEKLSVMSIQSENETSSNLLPVVKPLKSSELLEPQCSGDEDEDLSEHRVRFLISGHLGKDNKPVYIIQEYEGRSSILKDQSATFMTSKEQNNISVSISGRVFKDNILIEEDGKPKSLNIDPENIIIEPEKSKMFRDVFEETLNIEGVNILLKGEFLENQSQSQFTPFLSFNIVSEDVKTPRAFDDQNTILSGLNMSKAILYQPLFTYDDEMVLYESKRKTYKYPSKSHSYITGNKLKSIFEKRSTRLIKNHSEFVNITNKTTSSELVKKKSTKQSILSNLQIFYKQISLIQSIFRHSE